MARIELERDEHVARITINRPERMNAFDPETHVEFNAAIDEFENNDDIWLAVLTGAGERAFCAGRDLKQLAEIGQATPEEQQADAAKMDDVLRLTDRFEMTKPLIARVNGFALGGGLELALACDLIVAADHAELGLPEVKRGLIAGAQGVHRLPRQMPLKVAMGHLLTGRHMSAARAYELGLVNEVVPYAELDDAVDRWVADILAASPVAVRATKQASMFGLDSPLPDATRREYEWELRRRQSPDAREGARAFSEKRAPNWVGY